MSVDPPPERYSRLAPFNLRQQFELTIEALSFFSGVNYDKNCEIVGRTRTPAIRPMSGSEFITYLEKTGALKESMRYRARIAELLGHLERVGFLTLMGRGNDLFLGNCYYFLKELSHVEGKGVVWLSKALGPQFIRNQYSDVTVQLTGKTETGDVHGGTGLVIASNWVLTCAHVVNDMRLDQHQNFGTRDFSVVRTIAHPTIDVGLVRVEPALSVLPDLSFRDPSLTEPLYTLGYPRVPLARSAPLVMHSGEVITEEVTLLHGSEVFLYSATARPGNSGGPIISASGHVLGIVTEELTEQVAYMDGQATTTRQLGDSQQPVAAGGRRDQAMPFHAGIRSSTIQSAVREIEASIGLPFESYE